MRPAGIYKSHELMIYISRSADFGHIIKVKIFVLCRIPRPINGSKLIYHIRIYLYETSHDLLTYISRSAEFRLWPIYHG